MAQSFLANSWFTLRADKMLINGGLAIHFKRVWPGNERTVRAEALIWPSGYKRLIKSSCSTGWSRAGLLGSVWCSSERRI